MSKNSATEEITILIKMLSKLIINSVIVAENQRIILPIDAFAQACSFITPSK